MNHDAKRFDEVSGEIVGLQRSDGGVPKRAVSSALVTRSGMERDRQRNLEFHGGPDRALCLYSMDRIEALNAEGHPIHPGSAGENVTIRGLDWSSVRPGERYRLGAEVVIEITDFTTPCQNIARSFLNGDFSRILQNKHPGDSRVYARVLEEGTISVGDTVIALRKDE